MKYKRSLTVCQVYHPAFDDMKQLREFQCPILAMSATLMDTQIDTLKEEYLQSDKSIVLTICANMHAKLQKV